MLASVIVAATADGERYQQAARDRDTDNTRQQQREHDPSESSSHVRSSLRCSTRARPGVFVKETVQRSVPGWVVVRAIFRSDFFQSPRRAPSPRADTCAATGPRGKMVHGSRLSDGGAHRCGGCSICSPEQRADERAIPDVVIRRPTHCGRGARLAGHRARRSRRTSVDPELALALAGPLGRGSGGDAGKDSRRA
jgi:hypothetical protein